MKTSLLLSFIWLLVSLTMVIHDNFITATVFFVISMSCLYGIVMALINEIEKLKGEKQ
jgi:hypothetical protein